MARYECLTKKYQSVVEIVLSESFVNVRGNKFETPVCRFDGLDDVSFSVECTAKPWFDNYSSDLCIDVKSNTDLKLFCAVDGITLDGNRLRRASVKSFCKDDKLVITATVTYETNPYVQGVAAGNIQLQTHQLIGSDEDSFDAQIVVGEEEIKIHRGIVQSVSPVFKAMFVHNTKESKDGIVNIKDMDAAVVKDSINILYGRKVELKTIPQAIGILEFFEKYLIKGVADHLESWISDNVNLTDFELVIKHAWGHSSEKLQKRCRVFFYENPRFAFTEQYRQLPFDIIMSLSTRDV